MPGICVGAIPAIVISSIVVVCVSGSVWVKTMSPAPSVAGLTVWPALVARFTSMYGVPVCVVSV